MSAKTVVNAVTVERYDGQSIQLPLKPKPMSIPVAMDILHRQHMLEITVTEFTDDIPAFPWDGAIALGKALTSLFGMVLSADTIPQMRSVSISPTETIRIPWGKFTIPGLEKATITTSIAFNENGEPVFRLTASALMRDQPSVEALFAKTREFALGESIYRRKFVSFAAGEPGGLPTLTFKTIPTIRAIFSKSLEDSIERNILVPLWYTDSVRRAGTPLKRGILLAGKYGTGKTLLTANIAETAIANDWTVIEVASPFDIGDAIQFARRLGPTLMLVEDIDRVVGPDRNDAVNEIINIVDGVTTKDMELIMLFTSNHPERINAAMRRDGRIDVTLEILPPDADAVRRLVIQYGGPALDAKADLTAVGVLLEGQSPSKIRETIERSKLEALRRTIGYSALINGDDLAETAKEILTEAKLFAPVPGDDCHPLERVGRGIAFRMVKGLKDVAVRHNGHEAPIEG